MASIAKVSNGKWRARYRDDTRREHAKHFARKIDAQRWLDEVTASVLTGVYVDPRAGRVTFGDYTRQWQAMQLHRRNTAAAVDSALRVHALPRFGSRQIATIKPSEIQAFVHDLSTTLAPSTVRVTYQHLRAVFRAAEADRVIARTPCQRISLPWVERTTVEPLTTETVLALEQAMPAPWEGDDPTHGRDGSATGRGGRRGSRPHRLPTSDVASRSPTIAHASAQLRAAQDARLGPYLAAPPGGR